MKKTMEERTSWELNVATEDELGMAALVYKYLEAGICGPFTEWAPVDDLLGAEAVALKYGLVRSTPWVETSPGCWSAELVKVAL